MPIEKFTNSRNFPSRDCVVCGSSFTPYSTKQKYCGKECRKESNRRSADRFYKGNTEYCKNRASLYYNLKKNTPEYKESGKTYVLRNKEKISEFGKSYRDSHKEELSAYFKRYREENKEHIIARELKVRERRLKYKREHRNIEKNELWRKKDRALHPEKYASINKKRWEKEKSTLRGVLDNRISCSLRQCFDKKRTKWETHLGYNIAELISHLEKISGKNGNDLFLYIKHNKMEIDHRIPRSFFSYTSSADREFRLCWGLMNLQLKKKEENCKKRNYFAEPTEEQLKNPYIIEVLRRNGHFQ